MPSPLPCTLTPLSPTEDGERLAICCRGVHAGGITVHNADPAQGVFSYGIAIAPAMRRRGVASAALALLFARYRRLGYNRCSVEVYASNAPSLALHARLGFSQVARYERAGRSVALLTLALDE